MMITLTAGHSNTDPGAINGKTQEAKIAAEMRNMCALYLRNLGFSVRTDGTGENNQSLSQACKLIAGSDLAIEFHCNASINKYAQGVEALSQPKDKIISQKLCKAVAGVMDIPLRGDNGWKAENSGQHSRLAYVQNGGIILELFFISNDKELQIYQQKKWLIAKAIAFAISCHFGVQT